MLMMLCLFCCFPRWLYIGIFLISRNNKLFLQVSWDWGRVIPFCNVLDYSIALILQLILFLNERKTGNVLQLNSSIDHIDH